MPKGNLEHSESKPMLVYQVGYFAKNLMKGSQIQMQAGKAGLPISRNIIKQCLISYYILYITKI
jgi:hypothetical protein